MAPPTHRNTGVRTRLQTAYARAHKNWLGGYPARTEAQAIADADTGAQAPYHVAGIQNPHDADGTVDRAIDAVKADREARDTGDTGGDSKGT